MIFDLPGLEVLGPVLTLVIIFGSQLLGHCNTRSGPVAVDAKKALKKGDFKIIAKWVGAEQEDELRDKFEESLEIYKLNGKSKNLAREYFLETAVRLHREAEGMPYTGLTTVDSLPPDVEAAEEALDTGEIDNVLNLLSNNLDKEVRKFHKEALEAKKQKEESIQAGRKYSNAYVKYITFVHKLYNTIEAGPPHGVGE